MQKISERIEEVIFSEEFEDTDLRKSNSWNKNESLIDLEGFGAAKNIEDEE